MAPDALPGRVREGTLVSVNHDAPPNQLQLNETSGTFPFIWIALSVRCTIAKVKGRRMVVVVPRPGALSLPPSRRPPQPPSSSGARSSSR